MLRALAFAFFAWTAGCSVGLEPPPQVVQARFDPQAQVVPMPNDILRDATSGLLNLPIDDSLTDAEKELRTWMNQLDGWPTTLTASLKFSAPIDAATVDASSVQVWRWGDAPTEVTANVATTVDHDGTTLTLAPPEAGWDRGATYVVVARGGKEGLRGMQHEPVVADAAFYFLRLTQPLDDPRHERAFPGDTIDERMANGAKLEVIRKQLVPYFDFFAARGIPRSEIASLWAFSPTTRSELAMDAPSQRMPLPFDLLIDRTTGRIAIPPHAGDLPVEAEGKQRLAEYDGWALSAGMMFETTAPLAATVDPSAVALYDTADPTHPLPVTLKVFSDQRHIEVTPKMLPLAESHTYGVVVKDTLLADDGRPVVPMTIGHFMRAKAAISDGTHSQIRGDVGDEDAARVEWTRQRISGLLDQIGRDHVVTAIPFTTQTVIKRAQAAIDAAAALGPAAVPKNIVHQTPLEALGQFALGISSLLYVSDVYIGTLSLPSWLDDVNRNWHADGSYKMRDVEFTLTVPKNAKGPVPVVIFGHGLVTTSRFVLALGDALAQRGFAAISIDFPYHGKQSRCMGDGGVLAVVDPQTGKVTSLPQCPSGAMCNDLGRCVDSTGKDTGLAMFPVVNMPVATGAAFIEIDHVANTKDHFQQALVDLTGLKRSLQQADWSFASVKLDSTKLYYSGQSLGGITGGLFVPFSPEIQRAVLNVPGSGLVDMFRNSTFFGQQVTGFFTRNNIDPASWQAERFLNLARLFQDAIDPANVASKLKGRPVFIQMATLDVIIPNANTEQLQALSGAPRRDYVAEHAFIVVPVEPACLPGQADLGDFLTGKLVP
jgi:dienelactone hydrolase